MTQGLPATIALAALAGLAIAGVATGLVLGIRKAVASGPSRDLARNTLKSIAGGALAFALFGSFAVLALLLVSGALIAAEAPKVVYLFTAGLAGFILWRGLIHSSYGMEGCTRFWIISWGSYGLSWSAASLALLPDTATSWSLAVIARPLVVAAPAALLFFCVSRQTRKAEHTVGALAVVAALAALIFFPIENGLAQDWLPRTDWLRFPLAGLAAFSSLLLLPRVLAWMVAARSGTAQRRRAALRGIGMNLALAAGVGALLGLLWAVTRAIQNTI